MPILQHYDYWKDCLPLIQRTGLQLKRFVLLDCAISVCTIVLCFYLVSENLELSIICNLSSICCFDGFLILHILPWCFCFKYCYELIFMAWFYIRHWLILTSRDWQKLRGSLPASLLQRWNLNLRGEGSQRRIYGN